MVVATVCAPGPADELARRAWWAMEDAENARHMLANPAIVTSRMGRVIARYLLEFLPFETETETETEKMMASVRLILQPGLIDVEDRLSLWKKSTRKQAYLVGFLQALPNDLPEPVPARSDAENHARHLRPLGPGRQSVRRHAAVRAVLAGLDLSQNLGHRTRRPPTQNLVQATFDLVRAYFAPLRPDGDPDLPLEALVQDAQDYTRAENNSPEDVRTCRETTPNLAPEISAMRLLSGLGYGVLRPVLRDFTAIAGVRCDRAALLAHSKTVFRRVTARPTTATNLTSSGAPNPTYLVTEKFGFLFL